MTSFLDLCVEGICTCLGLIDIWVIRCVSLHSFYGGVTAEEEIEHHDVENQLYSDSNNIVVLHEDDVPSLADNLEELGFRVSRFREPDLDDQLTGVCVEPRAWRHLSTLQLAS